MGTWLKLVLIVLMIFSVSSFVWFLLGSTAYFQRGMDIIGTTYLWVAGIPLLLITIAFTILLIKGWTPASRGEYIGACVWIVLSISLSSVLIQSVVANGWSNEKISSDSLKITSDGEYEYRVDLVNLFQKNSHARLYLKDVSSGEELYIPTGIQTHKIVGLVVSETNHWIKLEPLENTSHYILHTTNELGIPEERFEIDIVTRTSRKLE